MLQKFSPTTIPTTIPRHSVQPPLTSIPFMLSATVTEQGTYTLMVKPVSTSSDGATNSAGSSDNEAASADENAQASDTTTEFQSPKPSNCHFRRSGHHRYFQFGVTTRIKKGFLPRANLDVGEPFQTLFHLQNRILSS